MSHDEIRIGTAIARRGEAAYGSVTVAELNDSSLVEIPVAVVHGRQDGPVFWVQNAAHGDEYVGMGGIQWLLRELDPATLRGSVIAVPVVNILAYRARTRMAPQDGMDMNRSYPGKPLERAMHLQAHTEMVLHALFAYMRQYASVVVDCHDGSMAAAMSPYADYYTGPVEWEEASRQLAIRSGMTIVWKTVANFINEKYPGSLKIYLAEAGIPSITLEVGGQGRLDHTDVARMHLALRNCLRYLKMVDGQVEIPEPQVYISKGNWLRPSTGGAFWPNVRPLQRVRRGDLFGTVTDLFGREKERLLAPADGIIVGVRTHGTVNSGEYCGNVGELD